MYPKWTPRKKRTMIKRPLLFTGEKSYVTVKIGKNIYYYRVSKNKESPGTALVIFSRDSCDWVPLGAIRSDYSILHASNKTKRRHLERLIKPPKNASVEQKILVGNQWHYPRDVI